MTVVKMDWKHFANWLKVAIAIEMTVLFLLFPNRSAWDIAQIGLAQYGLFFSVDASVLIKNIRGA